jgi:hypothetical protein
MEMTKGKAALPWRGVASSPGEPNIDGRFGRNDKRYAVLS